MARADGEPHGAALEVRLTLSGGGTDAFVLRPAGSLVLGRGADADLDLEDRFVSRRHCRVLYTARGLTLVDLGSANGTYQNGCRVERAPLRDGDLIEVGTTGVTVRTLPSGAPAEPRAPAARAGPGAGPGAGPPPPPRPPAAPIARSAPVQPRPRDELTPPNGLPAARAPSPPLPAAPAPTARAKHPQRRRSIAERLADEGYRSVGQLARCGAASVHEAVEGSLERRVVVKALSLAGPVSRREVERFREGAAAHARLRHKNVVEIQDVRERGDLVLTVMEHVSGETLARRLELSGGPLPPREALRVAYQVGRALRHLHRRGAVHRKVEPSNILLTPDGDAKLIGFGAACVIAGPGASSGLPRAVGRTDAWDGPAARGDPAGPGAGGGARGSAGALHAADTADGADVVGAPGFLAPEQADSAGAVDQRADIYGLGATLYLCITGRPLPRQAIALPRSARLRGRRSRDRWSVAEPPALAPSPRTCLTPAARDRLARELPGDVAALLERMLRPDVADRFQTPDEVLEAIERAVGRYTGISVDGRNAELILRLGELGQGPVALASGLGPAPRAAGAPPSRPSPFGAAGEGARASFHGAIQGHELVELLQMLEFHGKTGAVTVTAPGRAGRIAFRRGRIVAAQAGGSSGHDACQRLLELREGEFAFIPEAPPRGEGGSAAGAEPDTSVCDIQVSSLLLDALRLEDERGNSGEGPVQAA